MNYLDFDRELIGQHNEEMLMEVQAQRLALMMVVLAQPRAVSAAETLVADKMQRRLGVSGARGNRKRNPRSILLITSSRGLTR